MPSNYYHILPDKEEIIENPEPFEVPAAVIDILFHTPRTVGDGSPVAAPNPFPPFSIFAK